MEGLSMAEKTDGIAVEIKRENNKAYSANEAERLLLQRIAHEDREALTQLFLNYHTRLFKFVYRLTRSYTIADELVNDIMLLVWRKADTFRGESKVSTWIFGIAYRQTMRRVSQKQIQLSLQADPDELPVDDGDLLETENLVQYALRSLPAAQQLTVELVFYLGLSYEETAEVTRCPVNTVKTRMFHARRKLKVILQDAANPIPLIEEHSNE